jgi:hypothetical protein
VTSHVTGPDSEPRQVPLRFRNDGPQKYRMGAVQVPRLPAEPVPRWQTMHIAL